MNSSPADADGVVEKSHISKVNSLLSFGVLRLSSCAVKFKPISELLVCEPGKQLINAKKLRPPFFAAKTSRKFCTNSFFCSDKFFFSLFDCFKFFLGGLPVAPFRSKIQNSRRYERKICIHDSKRGGRRNGFGK